VPIQFVLQFAHPRIFLSPSPLSAIIFPEEPLFADPSPQPAPQQQSAQDATSLLTNGTWIFHGVRRTFDTDGKFTSDNINSGHWQIVNGEVDVYLGKSKKPWKFYLPINPDGTQGADNRGNPSVLKRISTDKADLQPPEQSTTADPDPPKPADEPEIPPQAVAPPQAPLPSSPDAPSQKDFQAIYTEWYNRNIMAHFPAATDPAGAVFVRDAIHWLGADSRFGPTPKLLGEEKAINLATVTDAAVPLLAGLIEEQRQRRHDAFTKALSLLPLSSYPKFVWFLAAIGAENSGETSDAADQMSLKYLAAGVRDDSFYPNEMSALRWFFEGRDFQALFTRKPTDVIAAIKPAPGVDPWVTDYVQGVYYVNQAWLCRGGDVAAKVTQKGWEGFANNLALARPWLVDSWNKNPHDPAAATEMIAVAMADDGQSTDTMREWFDRAVAADFDYIPAYSNYRWGLRPRWGGSYDAMNAFGRECAATGRYDTMVPNERIATAMDISDDANDGGAQYADPGIAHEVLDVIDHYFKQPDPCIRIRFTHTLAAIVADKIADKDEIDSHMAAIQYKPEMNDWLEKLDNLKALAARAKADNGVQDNSGAQ
jgi:hypothetical protein